MLSHEKSDRTHLVTYVGDMKLVLSFTKNYSGCLLTIDRPAMVEVLHLATFECQRKSHNYRCPVSQSIREIIAAGVAMGHNLHSGLSRGTDVLPLVDKALEHAEWALNEMVSNPWIGDARLVLPSFDSLRSFP